MSSSGNMKRMSENSEQKEPEDTSQKYRAEGILARRGKNRWEDEVFVKWAGYSCHEGTWHVVKKGQGNEIYGPELGAHYGWVDENGFHAKGTRTWGGIANIKKPQLAVNSVWSARVRESVKKAKDKAAWKEAVKYWKKKGYGVQSPFSDSDNDDETEDEEIDLQEELDHSRFEGQPPAPLSVKRLRHMAQITIAEQEIQEEIRDQSAQEETEFSPKPGPSMPLLTDEGLVFPDGSVWPPKNDHQ